MACFSVCSAVNAGSWLGRFRVVFVSPERAATFKNELKKLVRASWLLVAARSVLIAAADFRCLFLAGVVILSRLPDAGATIGHMFVLADAGVVVVHIDTRGLRLSLLCPQCVLTSGGWAAPKPRNLCLGSRRSTLCI